MPLSNINSIYYLPLFSTTIVKLQTLLAALTYSTLGYKTAAANQVSTEGTGVHFSCLTTDTTNTPNFQK